jgi:CBS domain-containing protein
MAMHPVREIMTEHPKCCSPQETVAAAARQMVSGNCGAIPVIDPLTHRLMGMLTDRDIACRVAAQGLDPARIPVQQVMSRQIAAVGPETDILECFRLMEERQVRRLPIVDGNGTVIGMVSQADLAIASEREPGLEHEFAAMVEEVSHPTRISRAA